MSACSCVCRCIYLWYVYACLCVCMWLSKDSITCCSSSTWCRMKCGPWGTVVLSKRIVFNNPVSLYPNWRLRFYYTKKVGGQIYDLWMVRIHTETVSKCHRSDVIILGLLGKSRAISLLWEDLLMSPGSFVPSLFSRLVLNNYRDDTLEIDSILKNFLW